ncbi:MAG TPA: FAD-binding oxidoreductase, partial [Pseudobdellovibrionaceae bacterium]|nr:FAD-binding oxidoreductase [Pseudobdellovibrionaceae bacterium]
MTAALQSLQTIFGPDRLLVDTESLKHYGRDWTTYFDIKASAVVFPETTEEVQTLVKWARTNKISLVPSGGRTGLSGGACALHGEVVVSFDRMNKIGEFNPTDQTVVCEAGVITESLQKFAQEKGLFYPVDFAAKGSSQIGGNVATNAGGIRVIRYGNTRN